MMDVKIGIRKVNQLIVSIVIGILLGLVWNPHQVKAERLTIESLARQIQTPEALGQFMNKHFQYVEDRLLFKQEEYWQSPEEMLEREEGDCEDYALFVQAILSRNGYEVFIVSAYSERKAHTVAVFEKDGKWGIFDLDRFRLLNSDSVKRLGDQITDDWSYLGLMRTEGHAGIISLKFHTPKTLELSISLFRTQITARH